MNASCEIQDYQYLVCVDAVSNHNKFYEIQKKDFNRYLCRYGRVGCSSPGFATYNKAAAIQKFNEKLAKGYRDVTELHVAVDPVKAQKKDPYEGLPYIAFRLMKYQTTSINRNYRKADGITKQMIDVGFEDLKRMSANPNISVSEFNAILLEYATKVPRALDEVAGFIAVDPADIPKIIKRETELLQTLSGAVNTGIAIQSSDVSENGITSNMPTLEKLGITIEDVSENEKKAIIKRLGSEGSHYVNAWRVSNKKADEQFKAHEGEKMDDLFHGSRTENFWSIIVNSLSLRNNAKRTGSMFGIKGNGGLYFAPSASKSAGYTSRINSCWQAGRDNTGFLAIFDVAIGRTQDVYDYAKWHGTLKADKDSVWAHRGSMLHSDEVVIYDESRCRIKYLVEIN